MGGGGRKQGKEKKCSCFSFLNMFRGCWRSYDSIYDWSEEDDGAVNRGRARLVGEDEFRWVIEPRINQKATDFIKKFHETQEP
ncbi:hypothetical protein CDL15_Pgr000818 [Punica granatum]|uniref:Uncharacterized protein n=1 Tax=Punica granatum TaxID=22663 RepID=A0A218W408_PUNGR|nr:hypothetical protein CDL15_Pgr000818 [Punica granatum]